MEDTKKRTTQPDTGDRKKGHIIELTPDLEVRAGSKGKIIELTQVRSSPSRTTDEPAAAPAPPPTAEEHLEHHDLAEALPEEAEIPGEAQAADDSAPEPDSMPSGDDDALESATTSPVDTTMDADEDADVEQTDMVAPAHDAEGMDIIDDGNATVELIEIVDAAEPAAATDEETPDIIELTDVVHTEELAALEQLSAEALAQPDTDDDEIIEMTDIVDAAESTPTTDDKDEIIELTDIVDLEELAALEQVTAVASTPAQADDDEIIELTDIVDPAESATTNEDEDEIIELTDIVDPAEMAEANDDMAPSAFDTPDDRVIRLDDVLDHVRRNDQRILEDITLGVEEEPADEGLGPDQEEAGMDIGIELNDVMDTLDPSVDVTEKDLERAVEQIIRTKYAETIEKMIASVVERVVTREMENIKQSLMRDEDPEG